MKKIPFNPYIVGNPIKTREMFFGRADDFQYVIKKIGGNPTNQVIVFCGNRRSGKTSILFQILSGRLGDQFLPVLVDMQILAGIKNNLDLYKAILRTACSTLKNPGITLEKISVMSEADNIDSLFKAFLEQVKQHYPGKTLLLLLDEYELIESKIKDGSLNDAAIHYFSGILESPYKISFIFTGSTNLEKRKVEYWRSLLGKSIYRKISYLSFNDTARLITEPLRDFISYPEKVVRAIYRLSGGQPFYTQVICQNIVDFLSDEGREDPDMKSLNKIIQDIVDNPVPQMIYSWKNLPDLNKLVLSALSNIIKNQDYWTGPDQVFQFLKKNKIRLPYGKEQIKILLEDNYQNEFLEKNQQDQYRFKIDLLRCWMKKEHSIWKVVKEIKVELKKPLSPILWVGAAAVPVVILFIVFLLTDPFKNARDKDVVTDPIKKARDEDVVTVQKNTAVPAVDTGGQTEEVFGFKINSNQKPFVVVINDAERRTSEGQDDESVILVQEMKKGAYKLEFISSNPGVAPVVVENFFVDKDHQEYEVEFDQPEPTPKTVKKTEKPTTRPEPETASVTAREEENTETAATGESIAEEIAVYGAIYFTSEPPGAEIWVDGKYLDQKTPYLYQELSPGTYRYQFKLTGYKTHIYEILVDADQSPATNIILEEAIGFLKLKNIPGGLKVGIDGQVIGTTPIAKEIDIQAGLHEIRIGGLEKTISIKEDLTYILTMEEMEDN